MRLHEGRVEVSPNGNATDNAVRKNGEEHADCGPAKPQTSGALTERSNRKE